MGRRYYTYGKPKYFKKYAYKECASFLRFMMERYRIEPNDKVVFALRYAESNDYKEQRNIALSCPQGMLPYTFKDSLHASAVYHARTNTDAYKVWRVIRKVTNAA